jgi:hypothetical protein
VSPAKRSVRRAAASVGRDDEKKADDLSTGRRKRPRAAGKQQELQMHILFCMKAKKQAACPMNLRRPSALSKNPSGDTAAR